jgi:hypothetical protein
MKQRSCAVFLGLIVLFLGACAPTSKVSPGLATLQVMIRPEPKAGYKMPGSSEYGGASEHSGPYARVDYDELEDIIVWLEADQDSKPEASGATFQIDLAYPPLSIIPVRVATQLKIRNSFEKPDRIFVRYDSGGVVDLGIIPSGASVDHSAQSAGRLEIFSDGSEKPICSLFVAPGMCKKTSTSRKPVVFENMVPGNYRVTCWHERLPGSATMVQLVTDQVKKITLTVGVNQLPRIR